MSNNCFSEDDNVFEVLESEIEDKEIDSATYKITTYGADFTLEVYHNKIEDLEIVVPPFQRKYVWPPIKASKLIESFLLGLPVPQVFLYKEEEDQDLLVVDGQQRLRTVNYFFKEKFEDGSDFYLRNVKQRWEGKKYGDLTEPDKRRLKNSILRATIFQQTDPKEKDKTSIIEIFERLNTGGMALTQQEVRNCVIRGGINEFLKELNKNKSWRKLFGKPQLDARMRDVEMVLRFLALYINYDKYKKPMKDFITQFMNENRNLGESERARLSTLFDDVMTVINEDIGPRAFRLKGGINVALFDSISVALAKIGKNKLKHVKANYDNLVKNEAYIEAISSATTDNDRVKSRIKIAIETFSK